MLTSWEKSIVKNLNVIAISFAKVFPHSITIFSHPLSTLFYGYKIRLLSTEDSNVFFSFSLFYGDKIWF